MILSISIHSIGNDTYKKTSQTNNDNNIANDLNKEVINEEIIEKETNEKGEGKNVDSQSNQAYESTASNK